MSEEAPPYPAHWEADVVLRDGIPMHIRPIRPEDAPALQAMHQRQSPLSQYYRFFAPMERLSERDLHRFTHVDHDDRVALVLTSGQDILAVGRYDRVDHDLAEVAFYVADSEHGRGLGSVLLEHLAAAGRERGVVRFTAEVLPANARMIRVFRDAGYDVQQELDDGVLRVQFHIEETGRSWGVMAEREQRAESLSMRTLMAAGSVVVAGLGGPEQVYAERAAVTVREGSFTGQVHLVGLPDGVTAGHASLAALAERLRTTEAPAPDLAVVAGDPDAVVAAVPELAALGVHAVVVLSGGFAEGDEAGRQRQEELARRTRAAGMRLLGPASYGVVATGPAGRLDATVRHGIGQGGLALFCQSAAAGSALLAAVQRRGIGLRSFVSAGNRADVSGNDTMQAWQDDPGITAAVVNLESIGNPRKFSRIARRLGATVPLITVLSGQTGQQVPPGHAVRTTREPQRVLAQMLDQAGVLRTRSTQEMLDLAQLLVSQPLPRGPRTAVLSNSGALTSAIAGAARGHGLQPVHAGALHALATGEDYARELARLRADDSWDALVVAHVPPLGDGDAGVWQAVASAAAGEGRPVLAAVRGLLGLTDELTSDGRTVPAFATTADAVGGLAGAVAHARWREADRGELVDPSGIAPARARELLAPALRGLGPGEVTRLAPDAVAELLACYGLSLVPSRTARTAEEAVAAAHDLGWPVALKTRDEVLRHRADLGGVRLDLRTAEELTAAMAAMTHDLEAVGRPGLGVEVQAMAPPGVACVVRGTEDDLYGPVVSFGLGGDAVELLDDVSYRIPPLTDVDVAQMVRAAKASPRLFGHRGLPVMDVKALENVIARVSVLVDDLPEVRQILLNPVLVGRRGAALLSAVVEVAPPGRTDSGRRVLPGVGASGVKMEPWIAAT
ncbi:Acyl-CoA synthetase (NDP forming) [Georgenia satyanarayanai]|uniref:Acyl-CoA synthetase (NDP forming) n=1 Tax=Georgenia satyanarayanai TaxID=860221 RepID=A0A2Y9C2X6_9MICO|nr:GNAT family N-acetyltransferase [Georgenia satyanarayanai]PYG02032.1 acyl-CoA synthetase (NDP forming) [Georgenia satyanarayanai]SSA36843.1 Acyl-CoA synthetase (NDP forming) [Georgenia satyanarayanai]